MTRESKKEESISLTHISKGLTLDDILQSSERKERRETWHRSYQVNRRRREVISMIRSGINSNSLQIIDQCRFEIRFSFFWKTLFERKILSPKSLQHITSSFKSYLHWSFWCNQSKSDWQY